MTCCPHRLLAALVAFVAGVSGRAADPPALTTAQAVRDLTPDEAARKRPVRLTGVVTHVNPHLGDFFLSDDTAGIYVHPNRAVAATLKQGDRVVLDAVSDAGGFAPCLRVKSARVTGTAPLPDPAAYNLSVDDTRWLDAQWVQGTAVVRAVKSGDGFTRLELTSPNGSAALDIPGTTHAATLAGWVNATVRFRSVCAPRFDSDRRVSGPPRLLTQTPAGLTLLRPADNHADDPPALIEHLSRYSPSPDAGGRRVVVRGTVTAVLRHTHYVVQDDTAGILICPDGSAGQEVRAGERVEVVGFVGFDNGRLYLTGAQLRERLVGRLPDPIPTTGAVVAGKATDLRRVRVEGVVKRVETENGGLLVILDMGAHPLEAVLPVRDDAVAALPHGATVEVTGVDVPRPGGEAGSHTLFVLSAADVRVTALPPAPPWWSPQRLTVAVGGLLAVLATAAAWVWTLRRQVRQQTAELRARFEKERELEEKLKQANKLEAMGRLAGGVAHDFNNLLTVINGCSELLAEQLTDAPARDLCDDVRRAGQRAAALTSQMLLFSRKQAVVLTPIDLGGVLADAGKLLARVIGEDIRVVTRHADGLPVVRADTGYLNQVVLNLALNARDAMPGGGTLTLSTAAGVRADGGPAVQLTVTDTGCGMDAETAKRVFEPFFTTKPRGQGTGLGLATVYGIVQTLGGEIQFDTAVGKGTTFRILFPATELPLKPPENGPDTPPPPFEAVPILLVEDDDGVRDFARRTLERAGYLVTAVRDPAEAERVPDAELRRVGVLLTDVVMPGKNGRELAEALRARHPALKVIFMSGYTSDEVLGRGVNDGEAVFLQKPFRPHDLIHTLTAVLTPDGR